MAQFFAFFKTLWELIKLYKQVKKYFDEVYIDKLEKEQKVKAEKLRKAVEAIEAEKAKPAEDTSDEDLMNSHRERSKK